MAFLFKRFAVNRNNIKSCYRAVLDTNCNVHLFTSGNKNDDKKHYSIGIKQLLSHSGDIDVDDGINAKNDDDIKSEQCDATKVEQKGAESLVDQLLTEQKQYKIRNEQLMQANDEYKRDNLKLESQLAAAREECVIINAEKKSVESLMNELIQTNDRYKKQLKSKSKEFDEQKAISQQEIVKYQKKWQNEREHRLKQQGQHESQISALKDQLSHKLLLRYENQCKEMKNEYENEKNQWLLKQQQLQEKLQAAEHECKKSNLEMNKLKNEVNKIKKEKIMDVRNYKSWTSDE